MISVAETGSYFRSHGLSNACAMVSGTSTIHFREYSPGLVSSILIWTDSYLIVRYRPVVETVSPQTLWGAVFIGVLAAAFLAFYIPLIKGSTMQAKP
jgi:hypothetical protein